MPVEKGYLKKAT